MRDAPGATPRLPPERPPWSRAQRLASSSSHSTSWYVAGVSLPSVPLVELVAGWDLSGDVDVHRLAFPMLHQRLLAKIPEQELLRKFNAAVLEQLHVRIHPAIDRHRDAPWPCKHLRVFNGDFVTDDVRRLERKTLDEMQGV